MNKITAILILSAFMLSTMMASAQQNVSVCGNSSLCDNATLPEALMFVDAYGTIDIMEDQFIDNVTIITKPVTINGNGHLIYMNNDYKDILLVENTNTVSLRNLYLEKRWINGAGIGIWNSTGVVISNYRAKNAGIAIQIGASSNISVNKYDFECTLCSSYALPYAIDLTSPSISDGVTFSDGVVRGYGAVSHIEAYNVTFIRNRFVDNRGNVISAKYGKNIKVLDSVMRNNSFDIKFFKTVVGYEIRNTSLEAGVILPDGELSVTKFELSPITIGNETYDVAAGLGITANSLNGVAPYEFDIYYNTTRVNALNLNTSTFRVIHSNESSGENETLTPILVDTKSGFVRIRTNTFSPFYLIADQLPPEPEPTQTNSGSGSGSSSTGSGGSSGGGAAASPESYSNIANMSKIELWWQINTPVTYNLPIPVIITPIKSIGLVEIRYELLKTNSSQTISLENADRYFNLWVGSVGTENNVMTATIEIGDGEVLYRFNKTEMQWKKIDAGYVNRFGHFAIVKSISTRTSAWASTTQSTQSATIETPDTTTVPKESPGFDVVIVILALVVVTIGRTTVWKPKEKE